MEIIRKEIGKITPDPGNVRKHSNKNIDAIKASLTRFGQQKPIVCDKKMVVRAGNGTLEAAKELGWTHINVVVSDLDRADLIAYGIADNRTAELAEWDVEGLAEQLAGLDIDLRDIAYSDFDLDTLGDNLDSEGSKKDDNYTSKIESPIYKVTGSKPKLSELYDTSLSDEIIKMINKTDLGDDVKQFLISASFRFIKFQYKNIAEYYAHSDTTTQEIMERLALVIIDFEQAIENGFVKITKEIAESFNDED